MFQMFLPCCSKEGMEIYLKPFTEIQYPVSMDLPQKTGESAETKPYVRVSSQSPTFSNAVDRRQVDIKAFKMCQL